MKEKVHENKRRNIYFPMTVKMVSVLWQYSKFIPGQLMELASFTQNTLNLRNCRLMKMDLETKRMRT